MEKANKKKSNKSEKRKLQEEQSLPEDAVSPETVEVPKKNKKSKEIEPSTTEPEPEEPVTTTLTSSSPITALTPATQNAILSDQKFQDLPIEERTKSALTQMGFEFMTHIQARAIPECLAGHDIIGAAKTGSGKTLAFLVPMIELLTKVHFTRKQGTGAIIISPTRELSLQTYGVLRELIEFGTFPLTHGLIMGGANRKAEAEKLVKGVTMLVATPGRLVDHLANTSGFVFDKLLLLVIDEVDRILEQGFEEDMHQIIRLLPKTRQTVLFSATQTKKVDDLARLSLQQTPVYVGVGETEAGAADAATVSSLQQGYVVCPAEKRFLLLFTFLKKNINKKIMVFFSSCNSVKFHSDLLNYIDLPVMDIHGQQKQQKRTSTFLQFSKQDKGILLCTDVAARGLDIPAVDWIVQFDPPDDPREYIHRVGRTARGVGTRGRALLFLLPQETGFLKYLKLAKVSLQEYEFPSSKVADLSSQLTMLIEKNFYLHKSAKDAYRSYLMSYASHSHKDIFNVHELDLQGVGRAFGFSVPPRVDLQFSAKGEKRSSRNNKGPGGGGGGGGGGAGKKEKYGSSGHAFSADNPYGKREASDKRQFSR